MAKLPSIISDIPKDLRSFLDRVREAFDATGSDKLLRQSDLPVIREDLEKLDPDLKQPSCVRPPAPIGLEADGAFANIVLTWRGLNYGCHSHTEIWRAETATFAEATLIGTAEGEVYADSVGPGSVYYYWIRFVSRTEQEGPYHGSEGLRAETGPAIDFLLTELTGQITESQLHQDLGESLDGLRTQYTVKIDANGHVAGFGLASEPSGESGSISAFGVRADRFWIAATSVSPTPYVPFIVQTSPQVINGVTAPAGVYITDAFIQNGAITNAKIGNATIDNAKIANVSADKLTAGSISVGSWIQSSGFFSGSSGWRIHGNGNAELWNVTVRGAVFATSGSFKGSLDAATGTFAGSLSAANGTFRGDLEAAGGTFKGALQAASGTFKGSLDAATGTFTGGVTATSLLVRAGSSGPRIQLYSDGLIQGVTAANELVFSLGASGGAFIEGAHINSLSASKLSAGRIDATNIDVVNLRADEIKVGRLTAGQINDGAITGPKLDDNAVTPPKIQVESATTSYTLRRDVFASYGPESTSGTFWLPSWIASSSAATKYHLTLVVLGGSSGGGDTNLAVEFYVAHNDWSVVSMIGSRQAATVRSATTIAVAFTESLDVPMQPWVIFGYRVGNNWSSGTWNHHRSSLQVLGSRR
jgi:hypothetical protein